MLWQTLQECASSIDGQSSGGVQPALEAARRVLEGAGFELDYLELRTLSTLSLTDSVNEDCALFAAAKLGQTRLIDNIQIRQT